MSMVPGDAPKADDLQFDQADFAGQTSTVAAVSCQVCQRPVAVQYYELAGKTICTACSEEMKAALTSGSGFGRFVRATFLGFGAAILGAALWYGIRALTGYDFGLIAIVVGVLVGLGVRKGAQHRGGLFYQFLAVLLTYCSVVATYVPETMHGLFEHQGTPTTASAPQASAPVTSEEAAAQLRWEQMNPQERAFAATFALVIAAVGTFILLIPSLVFEKEVIGLLIIAFALWEAWRINRPSRMSLRGPFMIALPPPPLAATTKTDVDA